MPSTPEPGSSSVESSSQLPPARVLSMPVAREKSGNLAVEKKEAGCDAVKKTAHGITEADYCVLFGAGASGFDAYVKNA